MRDFIEHGFEVAMVRDATAGTTNEEGDGYQAALVNWRFMAQALWTTAETVATMRAAAEDAESPPAENGSLFACAGMWEEKADDDGHRLCTLALITTTPNASVAQPQNRLPAMLTREAEQAWLDGGCSPLPPPHPHVAYRRSPSPSLFCRDRRMAARRLRSIRYHTVGGGRTHPSGCHVHGRTYRALPPEVI